MIDDSGACSSSCNYDRALSIIDIIEQIMKFMLDHALNERTV